MKELKALKFKKYSQIFIKLLKIYLNSLNYTFSINLIYLFILFVENFQIILFK